MRARDQRRRRLPTYVAEAMRAVLNDGWQRAASDYARCPSAQQAEHIFQQMMTVRQWLDGPSTPRRSVNKQGDRQP